MRSAELPGVVTGDRLASGTFSGVSILAGIHLAGVLDPQGGDLMLLSGIRFEGECHSVPCVQNGLVDSGLGRDSVEVKCPVEERCRGGNEGIVGFIDHHDQVAELRAVVLKGKRELAGVVDLIVCSLQGLLGIHVLDPGNGNAWSADDCNCYSAHLN